MLTAIHGGKGKLAKEIQNHMCVNLVSKIQRNTTFCDFFFPD